MTDSPSDLAPPIAQWATGVPVAAALEVSDLRHRFGDVTVLDGLSLSVGAGEIHALLGPNGAGKTTLLRALIGLLRPDSGRITVMGGSVAGRPPELLARVGLVPSGERTFYNRISGRENLRFFARMHGMSARDARAAAERGVDEVGLSHAAGLAVGSYSHGMQKRLSMARALLTSPAVLLVDEATHDLDPAGAALIRSLVRRSADSGAAVLWTTQRLDEIEGFADAVSLIQAGSVRFRGSVGDLLAHARARDFVVGVRRADGEASGLLEPAGRALGATARLEPLRRAGGGLYRLRLAPGVDLGEAFALLHEAGMVVVSCRDERSPLETAFLALTEPPD